MQLADTLIPLGGLDESMELYLELRRRNVTAKVHMTTSYAIAMLYTRFFQPRDHEAAIQWQNNAAAIASILPDARERLVSAFSRIMRSLSSRCTAETHGGRWSW